MESAQTFDWAMFNCKLTDRYGHLWTIVTSGVVKDGKLEEIQALFLDISCLVVPTPLKNICQLG